MPRRPLAPTALVAVALLATLSGCGVGQSPETYRERPTVDAGLATVGSIALRNVSIDPPPAGTADYPAGADATATLSIVNTGAQADRLLSASSTAASSVDLVSSGGQVLPELSVGAASAVEADRFSVVLRSLTAPLRPGQAIPMTFVFAGAGRQELLVPVAVYDLPAPVPTHNVLSKPEGSGVEG